MTDLAAPLATLLDTETIPWTEVPGTDGPQQFKILSIDPVNGGQAVLLKSPAGSQLVPHRHLAAVHVLTLSGRWGYENGTVGPMDYVYEPAGAKHHPVSVGDEEVLTYIVTLGPFVDIHPDGTEIIIDNSTLYSIAAANNAVSHLPALSA